MVWPFLSGQKGQTVQLKDADPNELQLFIEKMPASIKGKAKSMKCIDFGFGTKRHTVEPLAVRDVVYRYRQIKLMATDKDTGSPGLWCQ